MTRTVLCVRLKTQAEALETAPYPGEIGQRILDNISKQAWSEWLAHQTMLINENRLSPVNKEHRAFLLEEMNKFLFGGGSEKPEGYVAPKDN